MKNLNYALLISISATSLLTACSSDDDSASPTSEGNNLTLAIDGLEDLGDDYSYEGWLMVDGSPISAGIFNVDAEGVLSKSTFAIDPENLAKATAYILTIEPSDDPDPAPSDVHILAGEFIDNSANISVAHSAALGDDFTKSAGTYILATPTDGGSTSDELSGVWWLDPSKGPGAGLTLPNLPKGWKYEGWAVVDGTPISTGTFSSVDVSDDFSGFSGVTAAAPSFPGEDLLLNAPNGINFPTNLSGKKVVISIEPSPDNNPAPFVLKPLLGNVSSEATDHTPYKMENNALSTNPTGFVSR